VIGGWRRERLRLRTLLESGRSPGAAPAFRRAGLEPVPAPVRRFFETVLDDGAPIVAAAELRHRGTMRTDEAKDVWVPFTSRQRVVARPPGFVWDARIAGPLGLPVHVLDAYVGGEGALRAAIFGIVPVLEAPAGPELARGELLRWLAEAAWIPTALLPGPDLRWDAIDATTARATLRDRGHEVALAFRFGEDGTIDSVATDARPRAVGGRTVLTPWEGRFARVERFGAMRIPLEAEVAWIPPEGRRPYWRGRIEAAEFEPVAPRA
jgi:hypothetical protein